MEFPSFIHDLPEEDYFRLPYASNSLLKLAYSRSPLHAKQSIHGQGPAATPAMEFGSLFHLLLLQPDLAVQKIAVKPEGADLASNLGKRRLLAWMEEVTGVSSTAGAHLAEGKMLGARIAELQPHMSKFVVCTDADFNRAQAMRDEIMNRALGRAIFEHGKAEVSAFAEIEGIRCKARFDWLPDDLCAIVDPKTTQDASPAAFARSFVNFGYATQAALYRRIYQAVTGEMPTFLFVVVESEPPYDVGFYEPDADAIRYGDGRIDASLELWRRCEKTGLWPGTGWDWNEMSYSIQTVNMPRWA